MRRVLQRFLVPEEVDLHEASRLIKNPREGFCFRPLGREAGPTDYLEAGGDAPGSGDRSGKILLLNPLLESTAKIDCPDLNGVLSRVMQKTRL